jgi:hypothetical protein
MEGYTQLHLSGQFAEILALHLDQGVYRLNNKSTLGSNRSCYLHICVYFYL